MTTTATRSVDLRPMAEGMVKRLLGSLRYHARWHNAIEAHMDSIPDRADGTSDIFADAHLATVPHPYDLPKPIRCPGKNAKWTAYEASRWLREYWLTLGDIDTRFDGTMGEWYETLRECKRQGIARYRSLPPMPRCVKPRS